MIYVNSNAYLLDHLQASLFKTDYMSSHALYTPRGLFYVYPC